MVRIILILFSFFIISLQLQAQMEVEGTKKVTINGYDGKQVKLSNKELAGLFDTYKSVTWTPYSIVPIKIANTDAASGVQVMSKETRVFKNGKVWEKELFEIFYFDLEGKITSMTQYARDF